MYLKAGPTKTRSECPLRHWIFASLIPDGSTDTASAHIIIPPSVWLSIMPLDQYRGSHRSFKYMDPPYHSLALSLDCAGRSSVFSIGRYVFSTRNNWITGWIVCLVTAKVSHLLGRNTILVSAIYMILHPTEFMSNVNRRRAVI
ncbi:hypothetical protein EV421DRAFT_1731237 [Armillaria borealis]|uniref:Uncharacterized protein n=1 Tax=Armillaria borealis TaxID=47425 RepID=A0AA39MZP6_9AGAR|nr:hypothetical protein EV421DRAFT_1731237 [Armillaria borealis]